MGGWGGGGGNSNRHVFFIYKLGCATLTWVAICFRNLRTANAVSREREGNVVVF